MILFQVDDEDSEIGTAQVQSKEFAFLLPIWKILNICGETFDDGIFICVLVQSFVDSGEQFAHQFPKLVIGQNQVFAVFSNHIVYRLMAASIFQHFLRVVPLAIAGGVDFRDELRCGPHRERGPQKCKTLDEKKTIKNSWFGSETLKSR
uniref:Uncharacterized protein n=1 Tax=Cacopsylla melanoneura TaxID=428564 RepID=A0A8D8UMP8_9HEMI